MLRLVLSIGEPKVRLDNMLRGGGMRSENDINQYIFDQLRFPEFKETMMTVVTTASYLHYHKMKVDYGHQ